MAGAIAARTQGDDYQARVFWAECCRLFEPQSHIVRVAFEQADAKSFDDVIVTYGSNMRDEDGNKLSVDYFQVKFHVNAAGALTAESLINPTFINATTVSLLQRLRDAQQRLAPQGIGVRFILYSPWSIKPNDILAEIYSQREGRLDWEKLSRGGPQSKMGKLRTMWRNHLQVTSDYDLELLLRPLRIRVGHSLQQLQETLNDKLRLAGFAHVDSPGRINPYDDLFRKLLQMRHTSFTRTEVEQIVKQEGLWRGQPVIASHAKRIGIRSFPWRSDHLSHETDDLLSLAHHFDGRRIRAAKLWTESIYPELEAFLTTALPSPQQAHIEIHAHASIAFAAGYCLNAKTGIECVVVQQTHGKRTLWCADPHADLSAYPAWVWATEAVPSTESDVALALSVTHPILSDVKRFIQSSLPSVSRIIACTLPSGTRTGSIQDGKHAQYLAEQLSAYLKTERTDVERGSVLHIFAAAPNALLFFIGQLARSFGHCVVYEYAFESNGPGAYTAGLAFPPTLKLS